MSSFSKMLIKSPGEVEIMAEGGRILKKVLDKLVSEAKKGVRLKDLDKTAYELIINAGAKPSFLGYKPYGAAKPYPNSICASINEVIVHGVPTIYELKSGDILKIDLGVFYKNFHTDAARTVGIGKISEVASRLIQTTETALNKVIEEIKLGNTINDIGYLIESFVKSRGFKIVKGLTGHGIGRELHQDPIINNFGKRGTGLRLKKGMVLAIEPMVGVGSGEIIQNKDDSYKTADGSLSAHFEDTVVVLEKDLRILTK